MQVLLYSKSDCPLCQEAEINVRSVFGARNVRIVYIANDRELEDEFIFRVPVLTSGGRVLAEGRISKSIAYAARERAKRNPVL